VVECDLAKVEVAGSNPVSRSRFFALSWPVTIFQNTFLMTRSIILKLAAGRHRRQ
jgi:hypothetical protein